jgi:hypothetical protein
MPGLALALVRTSRREQRIAERLVDVRNSTSAPALLKIYEMF